MKTIRESKKVILIANGKDKFDILDECFNGSVTKDKPSISGTSKHTGFL